jgi:hypothetical protein
MQIIIIIIIIIIINGINKCKPTEPSPTINQTS